MTKTSLNIAEDEQIEPRSVGDPVAELNMLDAPAASNYDFSDLTSAVEFAKIMAQAGPMLPAHAQGQPGVCLALLYRARHWGIDPFGLAMESYQVKAGAPVAYQASVFNTVLINNGFNLNYEFIGETHFTNNAALSSKGNQVASGTAAGTRQCIVTCEIDGVEKRYETPMLKDIKVKNSPLWHNDPDQALAYYGSRAWARRYRPNLMLGALTIEDIQDASPMRDVTPARGSFSRLASSARTKAAEAKEDPAEEIKTKDKDADSAGKVDVESPEYELGFDAAKGGLDRNSPYDSSPVLTRDWLAGWDAGHAEPSGGEDEQ